MRKLVFILFIATVIFTLNLVFYILSEDYRFLIKKIKYNDTIVYDTTEINDEDNNNSTDTQMSQKWEESTGSTLDFIDETQIETNVKQTWAIALSDSSEKILKRFQNYDLQRLEKKSSLFSLTTEYPDEYFEYYSEGLSLYFFPTKGYYDVREIFDILSFELPYTLNQVNNFWEKSFYINLKRGFEDGYIRMVVLWKESVFWLKIEKSRYNDIKSILDELDTPYEELFPESSSGSTN